MEERKQQLYVIEAADKTEHVTVLHSEMENESKKRKNHQNKVKNKEKIIFVHFATT